MYGPHPPQSSIPPAVRELIPGNGTRRDSTASASTRGGTPDSRSRTRSRPRAGVTGRWRQLRKPDRRRIRLRPERRRAEQWGRHHRSRRSPRVADRVACSWASPGPLAAAPAVPELIGRHSAARDANALGRWSMTEPDFRRPCKVGQTAKPRLTSRRTAVAAVRLGPGAIDHRASVLSCLRGGHDALRATERDGYRRQRMDPKA